jgi:hypothetical protein
MESIGTAMNFRRAALERAGEAPPQARHACQEEGTFARDRRLDIAGWERAMDDQTKHEIWIMAAGTFIAVPLFASIAFAVASQLH